MTTLTISDWLMILAVLAAPLVAVQVQKLIERSREMRMRKLSIFQTLMATRASRLAPAHVQALNMIDLEFYGKRIFGVRFQSKADKVIGTCWKAYLDQLNSQFDEPTFNAWLAKGDDLFTDLLYEMSKGLGYDFDKVHLKRGIYSPKAHNEDELANREIKRSLVELLSGDRPLNMAVVSFPVTEEAIQRQNRVQELLLAYLDGQSAVRVRVDQPAGAASVPRD